VCFGSDSNVQTDLLEDARELEYHLRLKRLERAVLAPNVVEGSLAACLFANATEKGAASLGAPGGLLEEGRPADFFTVNLDDLSIAGAGQSSLLTNIVFSAARSAIKDVYVGGRQIIQEGHHPLEEEVVIRAVLVPDDHIRSACSRSPKPREARTLDSTSPQSAHAPLDYRRLGTPPMSNRSSIIRSMIVKSAAC
jgi:hypothetical protein